MRFIVIVGLIICASQALGQSSVYEAGFHTGPILEVYPDFPPSTGANMVELGWRQYNDTSSFWQKLYNYPEIGLSLSFADYGNRNVLGYGIGVKYRFQQLHSISERLHFFKGASFGLLFATTPFHYLSNPDNNTTGGLVSFLPNAFLGFKYNLTSHFQLQTSFVYWHSSNAHSALPNAGINVPALNVSLNYYVDKYTKANKPGEVYAKPTDWEFGIRLAGGINEFGSTTPVNGPHYGMYLLSASVMKHVSPIDRVQVVLDAYYNTSYRSFLESQDVSVMQSSFGNSSVVSVLIGNELLYNRVGLVIQAGYYVHNPFLRYYIKDVLQSSKTGQLLKAQMPGRLGMHFYLKDPLRHKGTNCFTGVFVKSNMGQADFLEMTLGVTF